MITKKLVFAFALVLGCSMALFAQEYKSAIGLRLGYPTSVSYKQFISDQGAFELFAGFRSWNGYGWTNIGAMYQHHNAIEGVDGLKWYYGGGASVFFWNYKGSFARGDAGNTSIGIMGVLGLDYKFADAPVNLSLDWVPIFFIGGGYYDGIRGGYGALSARYTLK
ncbi:MAG: hypothetical protein IPM98_11355 [Lewinellaceae bacterium]|nr:hypothetical protein [Lewinellaceae bacterium]